MDRRLYNIVVVNPDQMRWDYMTPNGHPFIGTSNLSRLAAMGTNFERAFVSCPMCGPSRVSVVTGQYPSEHGCRNYGGRMHPEHPNLFHNLKAAGYHRALFGKDHIMAEDAIGVLYDEGEDICIGNMDDHPDYARSWSAGVLDPSSPSNLTERLTSAGLDYIDRRCQTGEPFFLTLNYQDPHPYFACPEPYASMFSPDQFDLPSNFRRGPVAGEPRRMTLWRENSRSGEATEEDFKKAMAMYCGQIRYVDDQLGRVLDKLEERGILDETIVLFWSDHGEFLGDYGVTHKMAAFYDSLVRVPLVLWDPSGTIPKGRQANLVEALDVFATVLDLCGVPQPEGSRAYSLLSANHEPRADVFAEGGIQMAPLEEPIRKANLRAPHGPTHFGAGAMLRTDRWKLCTHSFDGWELYDLENDPSDSCNLYDKPELAPVARELTQRLMARMMNHGQAPEHLHRPEVAGLDEAGMPLWKTSHAHIELKDALRP
ncbi:Arylsulfatase [Pontiella desulfatans]|uniref:Arylsulfatase n=1 Tax=Pontiella desulfatans TaxID=2750659 RepID=A0A6C2TWW1_PONDE|nr:sulfatase-like hydrolase/transferase [Pontiella desulfatans]SPS73621.1 sulfatase S1_N.C [Kiritimatiellales bacterium]VGO11786.1 Arylsulfatase [Pontiella desulfatans]